MWLLISSIVALILACTVSEMVQVSCAPDPTPIPSYFWGGGVPVGRCTRSPMLGSMWAPCLKLYIRPWNYFRSINSNLCENHTSTSQTDGQTTYCGITALCVASRGKNFSRVPNIDYRQPNEAYRPAHERGQQTAADYILSAETSSMPGREPRGVIAPSLSKNTGASPARGSFAPSSKNDAKKHQNIRICT